MDTSIYKKLQEKIDQYSIGFNQSESGIEIKILEKLFTQEEAALYLHLQQKLESAETVAKRLSAPTEKVSSLLNSMADKGLVFPKTKDGVRFYAAAPFMHGFFEHQSLKNMEPSLAEMFEGYFLNGYIPKSVLALRTIPVNINIQSNAKLLPYDEVKKIIESKERIGLVPCACATKEKIINKECDQSLEVCIQFDFYAEVYVEEFKIGRWVSRKEALEVLDKAEKAGLVHQAGGDNRNIECICNCCSECCVGLRGIKAFPKPAAIAGSNYFPTINASQCSSCEVCIDRCPMGALSFSDEKIAINLDRCIGCGLCTTTCPSGALSLQQKSEDKIQGPPPPEVYRFMRSSLDYYKDVE